MAGFCVICSTCKKEYTVPSRDKLKYKNHFCSKACKASWYATYGIGKNNPNYGHRWSDELRARQSSRMQQKMKDLELRIKIGNQHRGIKRSQESIQKQRATASLHKTNCIGRYHHTEEDKLRIGALSAAKFQNSDFKRRLPNIVAKALSTKSKNGFCVSYEEMSDFQVYRKEANWIHNMVQYFSEDELIQFKALKFFHPCTNKNGLVRDHKLTRRTGYLLRIFPEILRHPVNCQLLTLSTNSCKGGRRDDINFSILFEQIFEFNTPWIEQEKCKTLIQLYQSGVRWQRPSLLEDHLQINNTKGG